MPDTPRLPLGTARTDAARTGRGRPGPGSAICAAQCSPRSHPAPQPSGPARAGAAAVGAAGTDIPAKRGANAGPRLPARYRDGTLRRIVRQLVAATLALAMLPALAQTSRADVFDLATGSWGRIDDDALSCETNPHRIRFQADRSRSKFTWEQPIVSYEGTMAISGNYTVLEHGADFLVMTLDGESRRTPAGEPVTWILRILDGGARYCWNRPDWAPDACNDRYIRCPAPAPVS